MNKVALPNEVFSLASYPGLLPRFFFAAVEKHQSFSTAANGEKKFLHGYELRKIDFYQRLRENSGKKAVAYHNHDVQ